MQLACTPCCGLVFKPTASKSVCPLAFHTLPLYILITTEYIKQVVPAHRNTRQQTKVSQACWCAVAVHAKPTRTKETTLNFWAPARPTLPLRGNLVLAQQFVQQHSSMPASLAIASLLLQTAWDGRIKSA